MTESLKLTSVPGTIQQLDVNSYRRSLVKVLDGSQLIPTGLCRRSHSLKGTTLWVLPGSVR